MSVRGPIERFDNMEGRVIGIANDTSRERHHIDSETVHRKEIHERNDAWKVESILTNGIPLNISLMIVAVLAFCVPFIGPIFAWLLIPPLHPTAKKVAMAIVIVETVAMIAITLFGISQIE